MKAVCLAVLLLAAAASAEIVSININNGEDKPASITLGQGLNKLKITATKDNLEFATSNRTVLSLSPTTETSSAFTEEVLGTVNIMGSLSVTDIYSQDFEILSSENQLQNWLIAGNADDVFVSDTLGWATASGRPLAVQACGGIKVLGGPGSLNNDTISKTYTLPMHKEIQITARYSFIDNWDDDSAFMKVDGQIMWTEQYTVCNQMFGFLCPKGHNACGKPEYPDRLSRLVRVSLPHTASTVTVEFGSTIPAAVNPSEVSFGISSVSIEVR